MRLAVASKIKEKGMKHSMANIWHQKYGYQNLVSNMLQTL